MNDAHYHLVVNHFPIIGTIFGVGILIAGTLLKSNTVKNVSYVIFIVTAVFAFLSLKTGGMAAGVVKYARYYKGNYSSTRRCCP